MLTFLLFRRRLKLQRLAFAEPSTSGAAELDGIVSSFAAVAA